MNQLAVEIAADAIAGELDLNVVPAVRLDGAAGGLADDVLIQLDCVLVVAPAAKIPPIFFSIVPTKHDEKAFAAGRFAGFEREGVVGPISDRQNN